MLKKETNACANLYLTPRSHSLLVKSIKIGGNFQIHPYVWNVEKKILEGCTSKTRLWLWYLNAWVPISYFIFVLVRCAQTLLDPSAKRRDIILALFGTAFFQFPATFQMTYLIYGDELPGLLNQGLNLLKGLERNLPPAITGKKYPVEVKIAEFLSCVVYYGFQFLGLWVLIFGFTFPKTAFLVSSVLETDICCNCFTKFISMMFLGYITEVYCFAAGPLVIGGVAVSFPLSVALKMLSLQPLTSRNLHHYRCIELWVSKFNRIYSPLLLPVAQFLLVTLTTVGIVGPVRYPGVIGALVGHVAIVTYTILYLLLRFFASINTGSVSVIERWRREARGAAARHLRALRPMKVFIGNYAYADMCLILTSSHIIIANSIAMLLVE